MTEQPRKGKEIQKAQDTVVLGAPMRAIYDKMCQHYGQAEVEFMKSTMLPNGTPQEFMGLLYLAKANGVNPLKRECYLSIFTPKKGPNAGRRIPVFMVGIDGFRARSQAYGVIGIRVCAVCENDDFEWDHFAGRPIRHVSAKSKRGKVVAGWGVLELQGKKPLVLYKKAEEFIDQGPGASFFHKDMGTHMMEVTLERHLYKMGCPGLLQGAFTPEEFGAKLTNGELSADPGILPSNTSDGIGGVALGRDQRLGLVQQLRNAFLKLKVERNAARWSRVHQIIGREIPSRDLLSLTDEELMKVHDEITKEAEGKGGPIEPEIVGADESAAGGKEDKTPKPDPAPESEKCETCKKPIDPGWLEILSKYNATKKQCNVCYYASERQQEPETANA